MLFDNQNSETSIIKVIGVGGGGSNAVSFMYNQGIQGVDFAICNTDNQALHGSPVPVKIQLGPDLTAGMGAGTKPEVGKQACIESIDQIRSFLDDGTKMLFITAGMGGGTGTGAAPIIAKAAQELDILTVAIVTLPFKFEGSRRFRQAVEGLESLRKSVDSILVISNNKLKESFGNLGLKSAFGMADSILSAAAKGIAEIITVTGFVNVDFEDVNTVMRATGPALLGNATAEGDDRARRAIQDALNSPLLEENDIRGAKHILLNISSGNQEVTMDEVEEITTYLQEEAGYGTDLVFGVCLDDESLGEKLSVTLIATGFEEKSILNLANKSRPDNFEKTFVSINHKPLDELEGISKGFSDGEQVQVFDFDVNGDLPKIPQTNLTHNQKESNYGAPEYANDPAPELDPAKNEMETARRKFYRENTSRPIDNPKVINDYENEPAYIRRNVVLDNVDKKETQPIGDRYTVSMDENYPLQSRNQYLHNNVD